MPETRTSSTTSTLKAPPTTSAEGQVQDSAPTPPGGESFRSLVERANQGDKSALDQLRRTLDENPQLARRFGDLAAHARITLIRLIAGDDKLLFESIERTVSQMEEELLGPAPSMLERLSIERVVACWLQLQYVDTASTAKVETLAQQKFWAQQQDRAHRRYQAAVRQLLLVRQATSRSSKEEKIDSTARSNEDATVKNPAPEGATQVEVADRPLPAAPVGNGHVNGVGGRNGKVPLAEEPVVMNGHPPNRILRFSEATVPPLVGD